jgi:uncharacterized membrane protein
LRLRERIPVFAAALWWGGLAAIGFLVVPLLFVHLPTTAMAGQMAARLFTASTWLALACGAVLLLSARGRGEPVRMDWAGGALAFVLAGMLAALLMEFAIAPRIVARQDLRLWHSLGTLLFAAQWLCAGAVLWKLCGPRSRAS